jgi:hypothetical protein
LIFIEAPFSAQTAKIRYSAHSNSAKRSTTGKSYFFKGFLKIDRKVYKLWFDLYAENTF